MRYAKRQSCPIQNEALAEGLPELDANFEGLLARGSGITWGLRSACCIITYSTNTQAQIPRYLHEDVRGFQRDMLRELSEAPSREFRNRFEQLPHGCMCVLVQSALLAEKQLSLLCTQQRSRSMLSQPSTLAMSVCPWPLARQSSLGPMEILRRQTLFGLKCFCWKAVCHASAPHQIIQRRDHVPALSLVRVVKSHGLIAHDVRRLGGFLRSPDRHQGRHTVCFRCSILSSRDLEHTHTLACPHE